MTLIEIDSILILSKHNILEYYRIIYLVFLILFILKKYCTNGLARCIFVIIFAGNNDNNNKNDKTFYSGLWKVKELIWVVKT